MCVWIGNWMKTFLTLLACWMWMINEVMLKISSVLFSKCFLMSSMVASSDHFESFQATLSSSKGHPPSLSIISLNSFSVSPSWLKLFTSVCVGVCEGKKHNLVILMDEEKKTSWLNCPLNDEEGKKIVYLSVERKIERKHHMGQWACRP